MADGRPPPLWKTLLALGQTPVPGKASASSRLLSPGGDKGVSGQNAPLAGEQVRETADPEPWGAENATWSEVPEVLSGEGDYDEGELEEGDLPVSPTQVLVVTEHPGPHTPPAAGGGAAGEPPPRGRVPAAAEGPVQPAAASPAAATMGRPERALANGAERRAAAPPAAPEAPPDAGEQRAEFLALAAEEVAAEKAGNACGAAGATGQTTEPPAPPPAPLAAPPLAVVPPPSRRRKLQPSLGIASPREGLPLWLERPRTGAEAAAFVQRVRQRLIYIERRLFYLSNERDSLLSCLARETAFPASSVTEEFYPISFTAEKDAGGGGGGAAGRAGEAGAAAGAGPVRAAVKTVAEAEILNDFLADPRELLWGEGGVDDAAVDGAEEHARSTGRGIELSGQRGGGGIEGAFATSGAARAAAPGAACAAAPGAAEGKVANGASAVDFAEGGGAPAAPCGDAGAPKSSPSFLLRLAARRRAAEAAAAAEAGASAGATADPPPAAPAPRAAAEGAAIARPAEKRLRKRSAFAIKVECAQQAFALEKFATPEFWRALPDHRLSAWLRFFGLKPALARAPAQRQLLRIGQYAASLWEAGDP